MKNLTLTAKFGLVEYIAFLASGVVIGEAVFFPWPNLFMFWLRSDSVIGFVLSVSAGAIAIIFVSHAVERVLPVLKERPVHAAFGGIVATITSLVILLFLAWNTAMFMGWPIAP